ncbi:hypothetical protein BD289DRAFT_166868 [Coniella lustricola]|uniref:Uncharacterized protein n=1 Tax=Coniella lustricola TaxID=2025994 RepID=A0A2T3AE45_9PEZI|nr:hypothetical protein BD289DRAFT_166868 [Coniella lustricola]
MVSSRELSTASGHGIGCHLTAQLTTILAMANFPPSWQSSATNPPALRGLEKRDSHYSSLCGTHWEYVVSSIADNDVYSPAIGRRPSPLVPRPSSEQDERIIPRYESSDQLIQYVHHTKCITCSNGILQKTINALFGQNHMRLTPPPLQLTTFIGMTESGLCGK